MSVGASSFSSPSSSLCSTTLSFFETHVPERIMAVLDNELGSNRTCWRLWGTEYQIEPASLSTVFPVDSHREGALKEHRVVLLTNERESAIVVLKKAADGNWFSKHVFSFANRTSHGIEPSMGWNARLANECQRSELINALRAAPNSNDNYAPHVRQTVNQALTFTSTVLDQIASKQFAGSKSIILSYLDE